MFSIAPVVMRSEPEFVFSVDPALRLALQIIRFARYEEPPPVGGFWSRTLLQVTFEPRFPQVYRLEAKLMLANKARLLTRPSPEISSGFFQANLPELVSYSATFPDEQRQDPIVALGTLLGRVDNPGYAYIHGSSNDRRLGTTHPVNGQIDFSENCRALLVRPY